MQKFLDACRTCFSETYMENDTWQNIRLKRKFININQKFAKMYFGNTIFGSP